MTTPVAQTTNITEQIDLLIAQIETLTVTHNNSLTQDITYDEYMLATDLHTPQLNGIKLQITNLLQQNQFYKRYFQLKSLNII